MAEEYPTELMLDWTAHLLVWLYRNGLLTVQPSDALTRYKSAMCAHLTAVAVSVKILDLMGEKPDSDHASCQ